MSTVPSYLLSVLSPNPESDSARAVGVPMVDVRVTWAACGAGLGVDVRCLEGTTDGDETGVVVVVVGGEPILPEVQVSNVGKVPGILFP